MTPEDQKNIAHLSYQNFEKCQKVYDLVHKYYMGNDVNILYWFEIPHIEFNNTPPKLYMIDGNNVDRVLKFVENNMIRKDH